MKKSELVNGVICVEREPDPENDLRRKVKIMDVLQSKNWVSNRMDTWVFFVTLHGQNIPAPKRIRGRKYQDGIVESMKLTTFKQRFKIA